MARHKPVHGGSIYWRVSKPSYDDHLATWPSRAKGGRWNPAGEYGCLYLNSSIELARAQVNHTNRDYPWTAAALDPKKDAPCLIKITVPGGSYVDIESERGIKSVGLPPTYPDTADGKGTVPHEVCQPIGARLFADDEIGIRCISAAENAPIGHHELVWFDHESDAQRPQQVDEHQRFDEWFPIKTEHS